MKKAAPAIVILLVVLLLYIYVPGVRQRPWTAWRILGALVAAVGYVLVWLARVQLGDSFSVRPQATELVTHGLYSHFRNPMYVFLDLMLLGLILVFEVPWLLAFLVLLMIVQHFQARREAAILQRKFGQAYLDYRRRTWL